MTESGSIYGKKIDDSNTLVIDFSNVDINGNLNIKSGLAIDNSFGVSGEVLTSRGSGNTPYWVAASIPSSGGPVAVYAKFRMDGWASVSSGALGSWQLSSTLNSLISWGFVYNANDSHESHVGMINQSNGNLPAGITVPVDGVYNVHYSIFYRLNSSSGPGAAFGVWGTNINSRSDKLQRLEEAWVSRGIVDLTLEGSDSFFLTAGTNVGIQLYIHDGVSHNLANLTISVNKVG